LLYNTLRLSKSRPLNEIATVCNQPSIGKGLSKDAEVTGMQRYFKAKYFSKGILYALYQHSVSALFG